MGDSELTRKKKSKKLKIVEVHAASTISVKPLNLDQFEGEAPEDEDAIGKIIEENVIDEVGEE